MTQIVFSAIDEAVSKGTHTITLGSTEGMSPVAARALGEKLYNDLKAKGAKEAALRTAPGTDPAVAAHVAEGVLRASYSFKKYKTAPQQEGPSVVTLATDAPKEAAQVFEPLRTTTESQFWASDLANEPANVLNPETYAAIVKAELEPLGVKVRVIENDEMKALGMGAITAVGQGSKTPPRMVILEYDGTNGAEKRPLALVGKGITFDSGGISLKPGAGMENMTLDMSGSAAVAGAIRALAARGSKSKVVGVLALAENMPDQNSTRPGDIVTSLSGKTIMIGNTDAEGRLVLSDAMTYVQREYDPHTVVDLATLTGAAAAALGSEFAAAFANDDSLFKKFNAAAEASGERLWRMPLTETDAYKRAVQNTPHADLTNNAGAPGALTAAAFLREFIEKNAQGGDKRQFMHIDMAGTGTHTTSERKGWGVLLLNQLVADFYEQKPGQKPAPKKQPKP
jgi:leucyl aminopeptidase